MKYLRKIVCLSMALLTIGSTAALSASAQQIPQNEKPSASLRYSAMCPKCMKPTMQPRPSDSEVWECFLCGWVKRY